MAHIELQTHTEGICINLGRNRQTRCAHFATHLTRPFSLRRLDRGRIIYICYTEHNIARIRNDGVCTKPVCVCMINLSFCIRWNRRSRLLYFSRVCVLTTLYGIRVQSWLRNRKMILSRIEHTHFWLAFKSKVCKYRQFVSYLFDRLKKYCWTYIIPHRMSSQIPLQICTDANVTANFALHIMLLNVAHSLRLSLESKALADGCYAIRWHHFAQRHVLTNHYCICRVRSFVVGLDSVRLCDVSHASIAPTRNIVNNINSRWIQSLSVRSFCRVFVHTRMAKLLAQVSYIADMATAICHSNECIISGSGAKRMERREASLCSCVMWPLMVNHSARNE